MEERLDERRVEVQGQVGGRMVAQPGKQAAKRRCSVVRAVRHGPLYDGWTGLRAPLEERKR